MVISRQVQPPNLETSNRGITKVIMRKHHNQPVGSLQLLFERSPVRLRDLDKSPKRPSNHLEMPPFLNGQMIPNVLISQAGPV